MKRVILYAGLALALLLQPVLVFLLPSGIMINPGLCLIIVAVLAMEDDRAAGIFAAACITSLIIDSFNAQFIGVTALAYIVTALFVRFLKHRINVENIIADAAAAVSAITIYNFSVWAFYAVLGSKWSILRMMKMIHKAALLDFLITVVILAFIAKDAKRIRRNRYFE